MKHACIVFCYSNYEHIATCFDSIDNPAMDFYVLENGSSNSKQIVDYFKTKNIKGYMQFENNISNNSVPIFFKKYKEELESYDYITFTDCDLEISNSDLVFSELRKNLEFPRVAVSCVDLLLDNLPTHIEGVENWLPSPSQTTSEYIECPTGIHLMTVKSKHFNLLFESSPFVDSTIYKQVYSQNLKWVKTLNNKAKHLTWDLYTKDNEYYQFKINNPNIWNHTEMCSFTLII